MLSCYWEYLCLLWCLFSVWSLFLRVDDERASYTHEEQRGTHVTEFQGGFCVAVERQWKEKIDITVLYCGKIPVCL